MHRRPVLFQAKVAMPQPEPDAQRRQESTPGGSTVAAWESSPRDRPERPLRGGQAPSPADLAGLIANAADALGFDLVGATPVGPSPDYARFEQWLAAGYGGEMAYLARRALERADPRALLPEARTAIVLGASYFTQPLPAALRADPSRGLIAAYAWGDDYHDVLKPLLFDLDATIRAASGRTTLGRAYVDAGPVLERSWGQEAGLGFSGKNTCLIAPRQGSWFFLAVLLTPEEVAPFTAQRTGTVGDRPERLAAGTVGDRPEQLAAGTVGDRSERLAAGTVGDRLEQLAAGTVGDRPELPGCGACVRCLDVCPTQAFPAPHVLDARRCISYLTIELRGPIPHELRPLMGNWIFGCDLCQMVCPYNRRFARPTRLAALQARPDRIAPRLLDLLALDEAGFRQRFRRSPVLRAKRRGLLRNVCVALGNWGDPAALPGLIEALHDVEPLVAGHAAWALGQMAAPAARQALLAARQSQVDSYVRSEIDQALAPASQRRPVAG